MLRNSYKRSMFLSLGSSELENSLGFRLGEGGCGHRPRNVQSPQKLERARKGLPPESLESHGPADALVWDFWPPELQGNPFLLFKPLSLWCQFTAAPRHESRGLLQKILDALMEAMVRNGHHLSFALLKYPWRSPSQTPSHDCPLLP